MKLDRERITAESYELLQRADAAISRDLRVPNDTDSVPNDTPPLDELEQSAKRETPNQRTAREIEEREREWTARRIEGEIADTKAKARTKAVDAATRAAWEAWADGRIKSYTDEVIEIIGEEFATVEECQAEFRKLREQIAALETKIAQLGGSTEPINLPNVLSARRVQ
jgi:cell division septum initiation protein DivIVA